MLDQRYCVLGPRYCVRTVYVPDCRLRLGSRSLRNSDHLRIFLNIVICICSTLGTYLLAGPLSVALGVLVAVAGALLLVLAQSYSTISESPMLAGPR